VPQLDVKLLDINLHSAAVSVLLAIKPNSLTQHTGTKIVFRV